MEFKCIGKQFIIFPFVVECKFSASVRYCSPEFSALKCDTLYCFCPLEG